MRIYNSPPPIKNTRRRLLLVDRDVLPKGYTRLDYLESNGSQYVDTGWKPNQDTGIIIDIEILSGDTSFLYGSRHNSSANSSSYSFSMPQISGSGLRVDYGSTETSVSVNPLQRLVIDVNKKTYNINGSSGLISEQAFQSSYNMYLFSVNTAGVSGACVKARLYSCKIYDDGILIRNYIPCTNANGVRGLYDIVNNLFEGLRGSAICTISEYGLAIEYAVRGIQANKNVASDIKVSYVNYIGDYDLTGTVIWGKSSLSSVTISSGNTLKTWVNQLNDLFDIAGLISVAPQYDETYTYEISDPKKVNNISIINKGDGKYIRYQYIPSAGCWVHYFTESASELGITECMSIYTDGINSDYRITSASDSAWILDAMYMDSNYAFTWNNNAVN